MYSKLAVLVVDCQSSAPPLVYLAIHGLQGPPPKDPYLPKPTDPTEPTNPENPDIEKEETYMRVEAKVLQWNLVSRDVVLE